MKNNVIDMYEAFWAGENDVPLLSVVAPKSNANFKNVPELRHYGDFKERWLDTEYLLKKNRFYLQNTYFGGAAFPSFVPDYGPDLIGAICGAKLVFGDTTSWAVPCVDSWETFPDIVFDENNVWWKRIVQLTKDAVADSQGEYVVGIADLHPGADALVSLRGPEKLCLDTLECPEQFPKFIDQVHRVYRNVYNGLYAEVSKLKNGSTYWMGVWGSDRHYVVGADFSCMINGEFYHEHIVPTIEQEVNFLDHSIYHLDGPGALRHLDRILQIDRLSGVQWVQGSGQPSAREWIEVYRKIQAAGKNVIISNIEPNDVQIICENLSPKGLFMNTSVGSEEEARRLEKIVFSVKNKS